MKHGDPVVIVMARNNVFPWQKIASFSATFGYWNEHIIAFSVDDTDVGDIHLNTHKDASK